MKKQLFLYLFIISALINVFTFMYFSKKDSAMEKHFEKSMLQKKDSINLLYNKNIDANYFSLEYNDNAQNYFENYDITDLSKKVSDALMSYNDSPDGNKFVDQPRMDGQKFIVNKIKLLNHRWIIADYSNGNLWGEVLLKYFINDDQTISFETMQSILYPKTKY